MPVLPPRFLPLGMHVKHFRMADGMPLVPVMHRHFQQTALRVQQAEVHAPAIHADAVQFPACACARANRLSISPPMRCNVPAPDAVRADVAFTLPGREAPDFFQRQAFAVESRQ